jgi:hypothetical protein
VNCFNQSVVGDVIEVATPRNRYVPYARVRIQEASPVGGEPLDLGEIRLPCYGLNFDGPEVQVGDRVEMVLIAVGKREAP